MNVQRYLLRILVLQQEGTDERRGVALASEWGAGGKKVERWVDDEG